MHIKISHFYYDVRKIFKGENGTLNTGQGQRKISIFQETFFSV